MSHSRLLCLPLQPSDSHVVVGMSNRLLSIIHRPPQPTTVEEEEEEGLARSAPAKPQGGTHRYFVRGKKYKPSEVRLPTLL